MNKATIRLLLTYSLALLLGMGFVACGEGQAASPAEHLIPLKVVRWCKQPAIRFRDLASPQTQPAIQSLGEANKVPKDLSWEQYRQHIGFTLYLPAMLPEQSCLVSVAGTVRDALYGSSFSLSFLLPERGAVSISEAPLRMVADTLSCVEEHTSGKQSALAPRICQGVREQTSLIFSRRGEQKEQQAFFESLQSGVEWMPPQP